MTASPPRLLAAGYRSPFLVAAVLDGGTVIEVRRWRASRRGEDRARAALGRFAAAYGVEIVVAEPRSLAERAARRLGLPLRPISLQETKRILLADVLRPTQRDLYDRLVSRHSSLRRLVTILPLTGRVGMADRWKTCTLIPIALGLAASRPPDPQEEPSPPNLSP